MSLIMSLLPPANGTSPLPLMTHIPVNVVDVGLSANRAYYHRITFGGEKTISAIGVWVSTQSGNISVAVLSGPAGRNGPNTRLATSGAVACPASGFAEVALSAPVACGPGDWLAISCDNATARFKGPAGSPFAVNLALGVAGYQDTAHPVPATPSQSGSLANAGVYLVGIE